MTTDRFHDRHRSRRRFLRTVGGATGTALASAVSAGCLSVLSDGPDGPPPVDANEELTAIAEIDRPADHEELPVQIADAFVEEWVDRAESLLSEIPSSLEAEIPNEAVRRYVERERESAVERLEALADRPTNLARLSTLRGVAATPRELRAHTLPRPPIEPRERRDRTRGSRGGTVDRRRGADASWGRFGPRCHRLRTDRTPARRRRTVSRERPPTDTGPVDGRSCRRVGLPDRVGCRLGRGGDTSSSARRRWETGRSTTRSRPPRARFTDVGERLEEIPEDRRKRPNRCSTNRSTGRPGSESATMRSGNFEGIDRAEESLADGRPASAPSVSTASKIRSVRSRRSSRRSGRTRSTGRRTWTTSRRRGRQRSKRSSPRERVAPSIPPRVRTRQRGNGVRSGDRRLEQDVSHRSDRAAVAAVAEYSLAAARAQTVPRRPTGSFHNFRDGPGGTRSPDCRLEPLRSAPRLSLDCGDDNRTDFTVRHTVTDVSNANPVERWQADLEEAGELTPEIVECISTVHGDRGFARSRPSAKAG